MPIEFYKPYYNPHKLEKLNRDTLFSPFVVKIPKREKSYEARERHWLLIILRLFVVVGLLLIVIIVRNTSRANAEASQLGMSQRGMGVGMGGKIGTSRNSRGGSSHCL
jgi:hypothetical protein